MSYDDIFWLMALGSLLMVPLIFLLRRRRLNLRARSLAGHADHSRFCTTGMPRYRISGEREDMVARKADAEWQGDLQLGPGTGEPGQRRLVGALFVPLAVRERRRHQPRGADRRRARRLLLDGARGRAVGGRPQAGAHPHDRHGPHRAAGRRLCDPAHPAGHGGADSRDRRRPSSRSRQKPRRRTARSRRRWPAPRSSSRRSSCSRRSSAGKAGAALISFDRSPPVLS